MRSPLMASFAAVLALALAAGCLQSPSDTAGPGGRTVSAPFEPVDDSVASGHPAAQRDDGEVRVALVAQPFPGYQATRTVTVRNSVAGFSGAKADYAVPVGSLSISSAARDGYEAVAILSATAPTEAEARRALDGIQADAHDQVEGGLLSFGLKVRFEDEPRPVATGIQPSRSAAVTVLLPDIAYELGAATATANIDAHDLRGTTFGLSTSTGRLRLADADADAVQATASTGAVVLEDVTASRIATSTSTGDLVLRRVAADLVDADSSTGTLHADGVSAKQVTLSTSTGPVDATLTPTASGSIAASTSTGSITLRLERPDGSAYDATASSNTGEARVRLSDGIEERSEDGDRAHARSRGYASASIQVVVTADSSTGDVSVGD